VFILQAGGKVKIFLNGSANRGWLHWQTGLTDCYFVLILGLIYGVQRFALYLRF
jgi:hypothetical protein